MFFWFIHLVIGIVIPVLIYCDGCDMREEVEVKTIAMKKEKAK
jgi:NADH:ubiquinone oxidoreductase subunit B-like Fe-S oxidoreductase